MPNLLINGKCFILSRELPIDIELEINDNKVIGYIFNQGNLENSNKNCVYTIMGYYRRNR